MSKKGLFDKTFQYCSFADLYCYEVKRYLLSDRVICDE